MRNLLLFGAVLLPGTPAFSAESTSSLGLRADCLHHFNSGAGSSQDCLTITGVRFDTTYALSPETRATLRLDPFATPVAARADTPLRSKLPTVRDTDFLIVDDYALVWSPRPNLDFSVESFGGSAKLPSVSGLGLANPFADTGWKQTALTVTYHLSALPDMMVKFAAGNGEGENGANLDAQQYFGFQIEATVLQGLTVGFGASFDGNSAGSSQATWDTARLTEVCGITPPADRSKLGHSTQRLAASAAYDGAAAGVDGLKVGLGWQRNVLADLDKAHAWEPAMADLAKCATLDPDTLFVEDPKLAAVNTVQRTTYDLGANYRLFARYFLAADVSTRRIDTGSVQAFLDSAGKPRNTLAQTAYAAGGGTALGEGLTLVLEYGRRTFDQKYAQFHYTDRAGDVTATDEVFDARIAYNWR